jgi:hypothetical protein
LPFFFLAALTAGFFFAGTLSMLRFTASMMSITWPCFGAGALSIIEHREHPNAILVFVILWIQLIGRESVNRTDAKL